MRYALIFALSLFASVAAICQDCPNGKCSPRPPLLTPPVPTFVERAKLATVRIEYESGGRTLTGAGTVIYVSQQYSCILTCNHVVPGRDKTTVTAGGQAYRATLCANDPHVDLALIAAAFVSIPPMSMSNRPPANGDLVYRWGFDKRVLTYGTGRFTGTATLQGVFSDRYLAISVIGGASGGGLYAQDTGSLVGVVWGSNLQNECYASGTGNMRAFLASDSCLPWLQPKQPQAKQPPSQPRQPGPSPPPYYEPIYPQQPPPQPPQQQPADGRLDGLMDRLKGLEGLIGGLLNRQPGGQSPQGPGAGPLVDIDARDRLKAIEAIVPWLIGGASTGGTAGIAMLALGVGKWWLRKRGPVIAERIVERHFDNPPPPQVTRSESRYVSYEVPNGELAAIKAAMDEFVKRNPGGITAVETIKAYAAQLESGSKKGG